MVSSWRRADASAVLRGLEHARSGAGRDERLADAVELVRRARRKDGRWSAYAGYPGKQWFRLEAPGASRWNTSRAPRVLRWCDGDAPSR